MLNRRNLRIKAMQTLFAFQQIRASNKKIAWDKINQASKDFQEAAPDLAVNLESVFNQELIEPGNLPKEFPLEIKDLIENELSTYNRQVLKDLKFLRSQMLLEVEGIHKLFVWVLGLFIALSDLERTQIEKKSLPGKPKVYLTDIGSIETLGKLLSSVQVPLWNEHKGRVFQWYKEIKGHQGFAKEFEQYADDSGAGQRKLRYIFKSILWKSESFQNYFEEYDRDWVENKDIIKSLVSKTLKSINDEGAALAPLSYQWEDDKLFFANIFDTTLKQELWSEQLIAKSAKNWKMDRIAQVDMVLLKMALSEMRNFPSIPVKVTINEYIEMSKKYSTPKSKKFINGLLDVLATDLVASGTIKKSGRGLIDNK